MDARPVCPLVLSLLAIQPRRAQDVARALSGAASGTAADRYPEAAVALDRLRNRGLVRRRATRGGPLYQLTRRGRAELQLQRLLWTSMILTRNTAP
jgi:DNA-binding PadR family transcriptional regulator